MTETMHPSHFTSYFLLLSFYYSVFFCSEFIDTLYLFPGSPGEVRTAGTGYTWRP